MTTSASRGSPGRAPKAGASACRCGRPPTATGQPPAPALHVHAAELVAERGGQPVENARVPTLERLQVRAVGQRDLDLDEHVARPRFWFRHVLEPKIARAVEPQGPHASATMRL